MSTSATRPNCRPWYTEVPESAKKLAAAFWPGPLTIILPKSDRIPRETSGGLDTVAVRCPSHPTARAVIDAAEVPLAAPSANLSGRPSPTTFHHVQEDLTGRVDALLDGGDCDVGVESTVLTLATPVPRLLRPGGVTLSQLRNVLGEVEVDPAVLHRMKAGQRAASPGMKYKHYSPKAEVVIVDAAPQEYVEYVNQRGDGWALCFEEDAPFLQVPALAYGSRYDSASQAHRLFEALHGLDEAGAVKAYAAMPRKRGVGLAVYNRLIRAAAFQVINPKGRHILGLTGPTGAGKSTAAQVLRDRGWLVVDCDQATRSPLVYDGPCLAELSTAFGPQVLRDGMLDRAELARRAFSSEEARTRLGEITFPRILRYVRKLLEEGEARGYRQSGPGRPHPAGSGAGFHLFPRVGRERPQGGAAGPHPAAGRSDPRGGPAPVGSAALSGILHQPGGLPGGERPRHGHEGGLGPLLGGIGTRIGEPEPMKKGCLVALACLPFSWRRGQCFSVPGW